MWRSGDTRRRRQAALSDMIGAAVRTGDFAEPWRATPQIWQFFPDDTAKALHQVTPRHKGLRSTLETNAEHPAIAAAMTKEPSPLSCLAGLGSQPVEAA